MRRISPIKPCSSDVFPAPTGPTIATSLPRGMEILVSFTLNGMLSRAFSVAGDTDFLFLICLLFLVSSTGSELSQVNSAFSISMAAFKSGSRIWVSSNVSASKTPYKRSVALAASVMELNETAVRDYELEVNVGEGLFHERSNIRGILSS